ncbi:hypothetical protein DRQ20_01870 [bacterium]|nr:MAG: hypothetical protein DRQ20_01870 [bacterium]
MKKMGLCIWFAFTLSGFSIDVDTTGLEGDSLQIAIIRAAKAPGIGTVWVAPGTYRVYDASGDTGLVLLDSVYLIGAGAPVCTLHAGSRIDDRVRAWHVIYGENLSEAVLVKGFTVTGGNADGMGYGADGGGIFLHNSSARIESCMVVGNHADSLGGGIFVENESPIIDGCEISSNFGRKGSGVFLLGTYGTLRNCVIEENRAYGIGGGVYAEKGGPEINTCYIKNNQANNGGGGVFALATSLILDNTSIISNYSPTNSGGIHLEEGDILLFRCTILRNHAEVNGGGATAVGGKITMDECRVAGNIAGYEGGAFFTDGGSMDIRYSLITDNSTLHTSKEGLGCVSGWTDSLFIMYSNVYWNPLMPDTEYVNKGGEMQTLVENYWHTADEDSIGALFEGAVNFIPYATSPLVTNTVHEPEYIYGFDVFSDEDCSSSITELNHPGRIYMVLKGESVSSGKDIAVVRLYSGNLRRGIAVILMEDTLPGVYTGHADITTDETEERTGDVYDRLMVDKLGDDIVIVMPDGKDFLLPYRPPLISSSPESLSFPGTFPGDTSTVPIWIKNTGYYSLTIYSVSFTSSFSCDFMDTMVVPPEDSVSLTLYFHPDGSSIIHTGTLFVYSDASNASEYMVPLTGKERRGWEVDTSGNEADTIFSLMNYLSGIPGVDTIIFKPGTYDFSGYPEGMPLGDSLYLLGYGPSSCTLTAGGRGRVLYAESLGCFHMEGFTIKDGYAENGGGIYFEDLQDTVWIKNCVFADNHAVSDGGACMVVSGMVYFDDCVFLENSADTGGAISLGGPVYAGVFVMNSLFCGNHGKGGVFGTKPYPVTICMDSVCAVDNGNESGGGLGWVSSPENPSSDTSFYISLNFSNLYYNLYQNDTEYLNFSERVSYLEHCFWWFTDTLALDSLFQGNCNIVPFETTFVSGAPGEPDTCYSVSILRDGTSVDSINSPRELVIEVEGEDRNPGKRDVVAVIVSSSVYPSGIAVALPETGHSTGIYRGILRVKEDSTGASIVQDDIQQIIRVNPSGDTVRVRCNTSPSVKYEVGYKLIPGGAERKIPEEVVLEGLPPLFSGGLSIRLGLPERMKVSLSVYDVTGRKISRLLSGTLEPGFHEVRWNGDVPPGMFFICLKAGGEFRVKRVVKIK